TICTKADKLRIEVGHVTPQDRQMENSMTATFNDAMTTMFKNAAESFNSAMQAGVKFQQQAFNAWAQPFNAQADDFRATQQRAVDASMTAFQANLAECRKLVDVQGKRSLDLLKKAFETAQPFDRSDAYETTRALWQETFDAMRTGMDEMASAGTTMVE